ncbi:Yip1 domain-containing protein [Actinobacteria bacterium OK074]|nr:Yip1 domain-containing protein [Actinobacteria bacterium OK074]
MSQLGSKPVPIHPTPPHHPPGPGTFDDVAGFRIGRGRENNPAPQARPQHPPYGQQGPSYGYPSSPSSPSSPPQQPYGGAGAPGGQPNGWPTASQGNGNRYGQTQGGGGGYDEPEYFGDGGAAHQGGYPQQGQGGHGGGHDPYAADNPGHTTAFSIDEADAYQQGGTYRAGAAPAPPIGPRLHWKELLRGIFLAPNQTFLQMRDYTMWGPALIVTFLYGLLAVFGFDTAREDAINATLSNAVPIVLITAVAIVLSAFVLGVVTHTLARQLGGDGAWQPTVGLSMLIMCLTDAPRLIVAMFAGGNASFVQILGWITWIAAGVLFTLMVGKSHDLPWPKALGASAIQLVALLSIVKLGTF